MPMYNLEYSDIYSKTSAILWRYCRDEPVLADNGVFADFSVSNTITDSFKIKKEIAGQGGDNGTKNPNIMASLNHLSNF